MITLLGTPALWWGGCLAVLVAAALWVGARDWRYGVAVVGTLSTWLPWLQYDGRPIFIFYAIITIPFMILAITLLMGRELGPSSTPTPRRTLGVIVSGAFCARAAQLRVVLADLHRPAAHPPRVAGADLVHPLDLTPRP